MSETIYIYIHKVSYSSFDSELQHPEERTRLARWVNPRAWQCKSKRPSDSLCDSWISWLVDFEMTPRLRRQKDLWWFPYLAVMVFACCMLLSAKVPSFPLRSKRRWQNPLANQFRLHPGWNRTHMWWMGKVHGKGAWQRRLSNRLHGARRPPLLPGEHLLLSELFGHVPKPRHKAHKAGPCPFKVGHNETMLDSVHMHIWFVRFETF
jgi:hypothetical protein